jgi:hypothetical protein
MKMRFRKNMAALLAVGLMAPAASAATYFIDFENQTEGSTITDAFQQYGITFGGTIFDSGYDYGNYPQEDVTVKNLRSIWGSDIDTEAVADGLGSASVTIGFESINGEAMSGISFTVARIKSQDITVVALDSNGILREHTFAASGSGINADRTVEEFSVSLDSIFNSVNGLSFTSVGIHNHGGKFGMDNLAYSLEVPGAGAIAGLVGIAGLRRRRR